MSTADEQNQTGKLYSSISQPGATGIVTFLQTSTDYSSPVALAKLKAQHGLSQYLDAEMRRAVKEAGVSERYLKKVSHREERSYNFYSYLPCGSSNPHMRGVSVKKRRFAELTYHSKCTN